MLKERNEFITVVSGLPRSGTSMMMRMLESGGLPVMTDGFRSADDDNPRGYYEYEAVKRLDKDSSWLPETYGKVIKVIYILLYTLPPQYKYKVIFMQRDLTEVIASQKTMLDRRQEAQVLQDQQLKGLFDQQLQKLYRWMDAQANISTLFVNHRHTLCEPAQTAAQVTLFLDLPLDTEAMMKTVDPTLHRNRATLSS